MGEMHAAVTVKITAQTIIVFLLGFIEKIVLSLVAKPGTSNYDRREDSKEICIKKFSLPI